MLQSQLQAIRKEKVSTAINGTDTSIKTVRKTKPATSTAISDSEVSDVHDTTGQGH